MTSPPWDGGPPYAGPPQYQPPQYQPTPYQPAPYQPAPYGPPPFQQQGGPPPPGWGWPPHPPQRPQRPGSVIAAAVLAFASALLVVVGTVYAMAFSALLSLARGPDAGMGPLTAVAHLLLAGLLVVGGLRALERDRRWLLGAVVLQLAFSVYWVVVLDDVAPSTLGDGVLTVPLVYAGLALVSGGLTFLPDARAWTARDPGSPGPATGG